jgi:hypothetical protein
MQMVPTIIPSLLLSLIVDFKFFEGEEQPANTKVSKVKIPSLDFMCFYLSKVYKVNHFLSLKQKIVNKSGVKILLLILSKPIFVF